MLAYLTAVYQDFKYPQIETELLSLFNQQYSLRFEPSVETRIRTYEKTGTRTVSDPETGEEYDEEYTYTAEEEYDWHVMTVTLTTSSFTDVITQLMDESQTESFGLLMTRKGNRQYAANPLSHNWLPDITETYGYYAGSGGVNFSDGVTISVSSGSDIFAGFDGMVTGIGANYIVLADKYGITVKYENVSEIVPALNDTVKSVDVIGISGSSIRLTVSNGNSSLNPLIFMETGSDSPQEIIYGEPGDPMSAEAFDALMAVARQQLGKSYVFGASGPDTFDCSGFVCYALNHSGVANVGRTNAQGLFNMCVPISKQDAQPGDLIFFQGTYSTVNTVTHVGIITENGIMINAGDPVKFASTETPYWQAHFYSYGRLNVRN